jgi:lysine 2,3-aminomutase
MEDRMELLVPVSREGKESVSESSAVATQDPEPATTEDVEALWSAGPEFHAMLRDSTNLEDARDKTYEFLFRCEREVFSADNETHPLEKANIRECIRVFCSVIGPINEKKTKFSALEILWKIAKKAPGALEGVSRGFFMEFSHLLHGVAGNSGIYAPESKAGEWVLDFLLKTGREAAVARSAVLDKMADMVDRGVARFPSGLEKDVIQKREENKLRIMAYYGVGEKEWNDHRWHLRNVVRDEKILAALIDVTPEESEAVRLCRENRIPIGITPYYLSLMDRDTSRRFDHAVRAQVIPPMSYVREVLDDRGRIKEELDFMGEHDTSPIDLVTRRYPKVAIFKPYDTCAQICVYCQRNWEIEEVLSPTAFASKEDVDTAIQWFREHPGISDLLMTGGDPAVLGDARLDELLGKISSIDHIKRIRIGTRCPVVLPFRFTDSLLDILAKYHEPGKREICIVTHFEHPYEVTPEAAEAIARVERLGIRFYNQSVFTMENSRRFELCALRETLRLIGVDPYYNFNAKGKEETREYRVPIARILQERKEEARLLPGVSRTDEPVFNVPRLGKNHLRAWEDHRVIMFMADGRRMYEFHPWEKNIVPIPSYNHQDVSIHDYLCELERRGENIEDYRTIWYYY